MGEMLSIAATALDRVDCSLLMLCTKSFKYHKISLITEVMAMKQTKPFPQDKHLDLSELNGFC